MFQQRYVKGHEIWHKPAYTQRDVAFCGLPKSDCFQAANFGGLIPTESCSFSSEKSYSPNRLICCQDTAPCTLLQRSASWKLQKRWLTSGVALTLAFDAHSSMSDIGFGYARFLAPFSFFLQLPGEPFGINPSVSKKSELE